MDGPPIQVSSAILQSAKKAMFTWNCKICTAEFAKKLLPGFEQHTLGSAKFIKNVAQALVIVCWKFQSLLDGINNPAKEHFCGVPIAVAFQD